MTDVLIEIIKKDFETVPFHNFRLILNRDMNLELGGTCSDRTIYMKHKLDKFGIDSSLHSAKINGLDIHRMLKVKIENEPYILDIGLGWPLLHPISLINEMKFNFFGLYFETKIHNGKLSLYKKDNDKYKISYNTILADQNQRVILEQINSRFINTKIYPFNDSIRFSKVVNGEFYFLKGNVLCYSENNIFRRRLISTEADFISLFDDIFDFEVDIAIEVAKKTNMYKF